MGLHSSYCRTGRFLWEDACTAPNSKVKLHNLGIQSRDTHMMSVAQLRQHSSGGDARGPEEEPLVAPATLPLACVFFKQATTGGTTQQ